MTLEEGALMEPLSVGVHACNRANVTVGQDILICGAGPIGLVSMMAARARGANRIVITDISEQRLQVAKKLGAYGTYLVKKGADATKEICEQFFDGEKPHVSIECSGAEPSINLCLDITRNGGKATLVGMGPPVVKVSPLRTIPV